MARSAILRAGWLLVGIFASLLLASCNGQVPLTAPAGATITMTANPTSIPIQGGESTITVVGFRSEADGGGTLPDGTQIFFTADLGIIDERVVMRNGIARATLRSNGVAGLATIDARSGSGVEAAAVTVEIGAGPDAGLVILLTANPATLGPGEDSSLIVATVTDNRGNALANIPLVFSTTAGSLASRGSVLRTNGAGQASDRLTLGESDQTATVTATSGSTLAAQNAVVTRSTPVLPIIDSVTPPTGARGTTVDVTITGQNFQPGATVSFGEGIGINDVTFVNSETIVPNITIFPAALPGTRTVTVTNPDGGSVTVANFFEVI